MSAAERFRIKRPEVIHEILDDELVIVNLKTGAYFSLDRVGAVVWQALERQATIAEVIGDVIARFDGERQLIESEIAGLLEELQRQELIAPYPGPPAAAAVPAAAADGRAPFVAPVLQKYTDMQELLLLDPVHDVDESGWPSRGN